MKLKRILAVLLAAVMVFSLAACGSSSDDTSDETDAAEAEETEEATDSDFTWNGEYEVWAIVPTTEAVGLMMHVNTMGWAMEQCGWTYTAYSSAESSEVQLIEQAISAQTVGALMIATSDPAMIEDSCNEAAEAGIAICFLGAEPDGYEIAGYIATAYSITGMAAVYAAQDWVEQRVAEGGDIPTNDDGTYPVYVDYYTGNVNFIYRSNALFGTIEEGGFFTVAAANQSYGDGQTTTAEQVTAALAANPDIRVFIVMEPDQALGAESAVEDFAEQQGLSLEDFCIIPCYAEDDTFAADYEEVYADHSAYAIKGSATYGGTATEEEEAEYAKTTTYDTAYSPTGAKLAYILLGVTGTGNDGEEWTFGDAYYDDISSYNVYDYSYSWVQGDDNPCTAYEVDTYQYSY